MPRTLTLEEVRTVCFAMEDEMAGRGTGEIARWWLEQGQDPDLIRALGVHHGHASGEGASVGSFAMGMTLGWMLRSAAE